MQQVVVVVVVVYVLLFYSLWGLVVNLVGTVLCCREDNVTLLLMPNLDWNKATSTETLWSASNLATCTGPSLKSGPVHCCQGPVWGWMNWVQFYTCHQSTVFWSFKLHINMLWIYIIYVLVRVYSSVDKLVTLSVTCKAKIGHINDEIMSFPKIIHLHQMFGKHRG